MKAPGLRLERDIWRMRNDNFVKICRLKPNFFTRNRKMPLHDLLLSELNRRGATLAMELRRFKDNAKKDSSISKAGYLKQRMKLNPEGFVNLNDFHLTNFYHEVDYLYKVNDYLILAADGSAINIPTTLENIEQYGSSSKKGTKPQAALGLSCLYDLGNKMILDGTINRCKFNEAQQAEKHLAKLPSILGKHKYLVILDRGYPSIPLFIRMCDKNQKFLVRLKSCDFKKEKSQMKTTDEDVVIQFTKDRMNHYKETEIGKIMKERKTITIRFIKIELENGNVEYLATNLTKEEFTTEEIRKLYPMRWGVETAFEVLKNKLEIENFTGTKSLLIEQDIYSCIYLYNLIQDIIMGEEEEMKEELEGKYKYRMMINRTLAIGILREELVTIIYENDPIKKLEIYRGILSEIRKHLIPIRSARHFKRTKGNFRGKYSNTHKRSC